MSDKLIVAVDSQIDALVPRFRANRGGDADETRAALAGADFEAIRAAPQGMKGADGGHGYPGTSRPGVALKVGARQRGHPAQDAP